MGIRFGKSFKLGGGFRINLSSRGIGTSWGMKGFRIGSGPSGTRVHVGIPGTGISWSSGVGGRRVGSSSAANHRRLAAARRETEKFDELRRNQYEVQLYEEHLRALVSLHREGWAVWDWTAVASTSAPREPSCERSREIPATQALTEFKPGVMDKLLGVDRRRKALEEAVLNARILDDHDHTAALAVFQLEVQRWEWFQRLARGVLSGQAEACQAVLDHLGPFETFQTLGSTLNVSVTQSWCVEAWLTANDQRVVPNEKISLTSTGKLSRRAMPKTTYWGIYQDHVCSAALRIAREIFALLPIPVAFVHVGYPSTNSSTGARDLYAILSVAFDRETFVALNLDAIDPSDSMANFEHRMKYKKSSGFSPVDILTPDDIEASDA